MAIRQTQRSDCLVEPGQQRGEIDIAIVGVDRRCLERAAQRGGDAGLGWRKFDPDQSAIHSVGLRLPQMVTGISHWAINGPLAGMFREMIDLDAILS